MNFKLDENLPRELAAELDQLGHDADTVYGEGLVGADDVAIVDAAKSAGRILMTLDKGLPSLLRHPGREHAGVVLFRPDSLGRQSVLAFVRHRLETLLAIDLAERLTVVGPTRIRIR